MVQLIIVVGNRKRSSAYPARLLDYYANALLHAIIGGCDLDLPKSGVAMADLAALLPTLLSRGGNPIFPLYYLCCEQRLAPSLLYIILILFEFIMYVTIM